MQRRARREGQRKLGVDDRLADPQRHQSVRCLAQHHGLEHLTRLEQRALHRGARDGRWDLGLDRTEHPLNLPDSG
jgi:hypothetical protein